jgi:adenylate kinase
MLLIQVTGTPGSGKSSFAESLAKSTGARLIEANEIVEEQKLFSGIDETGSKIVKMRELCSAIKRKIGALEKERGTGAVILVGHLVPDLDIKPDISIVIRVGLRELIGRLESRKYTKEKIRENLVSESVDYCGEMAMEKSGETYEVESGREKEEVIAYIKSRLEGANPVPPIFREINKMHDLLDLVYDGNKYGL